MKRNSSIEILRIILMMMVVVWHFIVHGTDLVALSWGGYEWSDKSLSYVLLLGILGPSVVCFIFISGYYGIQPKVRTGVFFIGMALFYSVIGTIIPYLFGASIDNHDLYIMLCPISTKAWWFFTAYFILYIIANPINKYLDSLSQKKFLFVLAFIYVGIYWYHQVAGKIGGTSIGQPYLLLFIYVLGRYIKKFPIPILERKPLLIYSITTGFVLLILLTLSIVRPGSSLIWYVYMTGNPLTMVSAISLFFVFAKYKFVNKWINYLSSSVFAIYLLTDYPTLRNLLDKFIFELTNGNILLMILIAVAIGICCLLIDKIRIWIFTSIESAFIRKKMSING